MTIVQTRMVLEMAGNVFGGRGALAGRESEENVHSEGKDKRRGRVI